MVNDITQIAIIIILIGPNKTTIRQSSSLIRLSFCLLSAAKPQGNEPSLIKLSFFTHIIQVKKVTFWCSQSDDRSKIFNMDKNCFYIKFVGEKEIKHCKHNYLFSLLFVEPFFLNKWFITRSQSIDLFVTRSSIIYQAQVTNDPNLCFLVNTEFTMSMKLHIY